VGLWALNCYEVIIEMLNPTTVIWVLLPILLVFTVLLLIYRRRLDREPNLLKRGFRLFRLNLILLGLFTAIAGLFVFPLAPPLSTFGYPETVADIQDAEQLLRYLQQYNRALVTNLHAFSWFLYIFAFWFLSSIYGFAKVITDALLARSVEQVRQ